MIMIIKSGNQIDKPKVSETTMLFRPVQIHRVFRPSFNCKNKFVDCGAKAVAKSKLGKNETKHEITARLESDQCSFDP